MIYTYILFYSFLPHTILGFGVKKNIHILLHFFSGSDFCNRLILAPDMIVNLKFILSIHFYGVNNEVLNDLVMKLISSGYLSLFKTSSAAAICHFY